MSLFFQPFRELSSKGRLTRTLESRKHDDSGRIFCELKTTLCTPQNRDEFVVHDLNNLLGRVESLVDFITERAFTDFTGELFYDIESDVSFEKSPTNLANRTVNVTRRELTLIAKVRKCLGEAI